MFEVQEAADLVTSAADENVNVIFGNVINENLNEEVIVTVIATGFDESKKAQQQHNQTRQNPLFQQQAAAKQQQEKRDIPQKQQTNEEYGQNDETLDIPTFLRNRNRNR